MQDRLKSLFLFLTFRDPAAAKTFVIEDMRFLVALAAALPTSILALSGVWFWTLAISPFLFAAVFFVLIYTFLQLGHCYDYIRGRPDHV